MLLEWLPVEGSRAETVNLLVRTESRTICSQDIGRVSVTIDLRSLRLVCLIFFFPTKINKKCFVDSLQNILRKVTATNLFYSSSDVIRVKSHQGEIPSDKSPRTWSSIWAAGEPWWSLCGGKLCSLLVITNLSYPFYPLRIWIAA